jgi:hypothetical protein
MSDSIDELRALARRIGWTSLVGWACVGLALEGANGFKLSSYLDDALTRELCTLGHAHGVGLALVMLAFGEAGLPVLATAARRPTLLLLAGGSALVPVAFLLSSIAHPEGDPNFLVWLVPIGALMILAALTRTAIASWTRRAPEPED